MKRYMALLLAAILLLTCVSCADQKDGTVIPVDTSTAVSGQSICRYDENGNLVECILGDVRTVYEYNSRGDCLKEIRYESGAEVQRQIYAYNDSGILTETVCYRSGKKLWRKSYPEEGGYHYYTYPGENEGRREIYRENGELAEVAVFRDGEEISRNVYTYNSSGTLGEDCRYENGVYTMSTQYLYNEDGEQIRVRVEVPGKTVDSEIQTTFIRVQAVYRDGKLQTETYFEHDELTKILTYDGNAAPVEAVYRENGQVSFTQRFQYDDRGELIACVTTREGVSTEETYRRVYEAQRPVRTEKRVDGVLQEVTRYDADGRVAKKVFYTDGRESGAEEYTYLKSGAEIRDAQGNLTKTLICDAGGRVRTHSYYRDNELSVQEFFDGDGRLTQRVVYGEDRAERELVIYEQVEETPKSGLVTAQLVTGIYFPNYDMGPGSLRFDYQGTRLVKKIFNGEAWVETNYNGDYDRPLSEQYHFSSEPGRVYTYDEEGKLLEEACLTNGEVVTNTLFFYDDQGRLIEDKSFADGREFGKTYTYNHDGELIESCLWHDGKLSSCNTYLVDRQGNCILSRWDSGSQVQETAWKYDENGNVLLRTTYRDGKQNTQTVFTYDETGRLIQKQYTSDTWKSNEIYEYDDAGRMTRVYEGEYPVKTWTYDAQGRLQDYIRYNYNDIGESTHLRYLYDENGMIYEIVLEREDYPQSSVLITYQTVEVTPEEAEELDAFAHRILDRLIY